MTPKKAPGRYCLAVCYCGDCDHYQPVKPARDVQPTDQKTTRRKSWDEREESTWIDRL